MLAPVALLLCLVGGSRQLSITEFVVPPVVELSENAELRCRYELAGAGEKESSVIVKWWWTSTNDSAVKKLLYQRIGSNPSQLILKENKESKGNDTIVLLAPSPLDSGSYECEVSFLDVGAKEIRVHQKLSVFTPGTGPNVTLSDLPDGPDDEDNVEDVLVECSADDVAPQPFLVLTVNGEEFKMIEELSGPDSVGLYNVTANVTLSQLKADSEVSCELFYHDKDVLHPQYIDTELYNTSGPQNTTEADVAPEPDAAIDSLQTTNAVYQSQVSWAVLLVLALSSQALL